MGAAGLIAAAALFEQSELPAPVGINHGQAVVELPSKDLLACWYSGATERGRDARILCSRSRDQGRDWSTPRAAVAPDEQATGARAANKSVGNVTLTLDARARLWMIYGVVQRRDVPVIGDVCKSWGCGRIDAQVSLDEGRSWSKGVRLDDQPGALPRSKPLALPSGVQLAPLYLERGRRAYIRMLDLTASRPEAIAASPPYPLPGPHTIQPSLVAQFDGRVRAFLRDPAKVAVYTAAFDPASRSWSPPVATNLPNPSSAIDAFTDDRGRYVLIYNPSRRSRATLSLASSTDGMRFTKGCDLAAASAQGDVAYPYVIRASDRTWHVVYSSGGKRRIRHVRFDAAWLDACLSPSG